MLLTIDIENKTIGNKELFHNLRFTVEPRQKTAIIGRNGVGKTTLFAMLTGRDADYNGSINRRSGVSLISTAQEHHLAAQQTVLEYVLSNLPEYERLKNILDTYPAAMGDNLRKITTYSTALERFTELDYFRIEDEIVRNLEKYQITPAMAEAPMSRLSGGQKRFVELVRIECSPADVVLIDEPTNHMDYVAKAAFIDWLKAATQAVLVITHDRDVLQWVDRIVEIKDGTALIFKGNYESYLAQNATATTSKIHDYEVAQQTLANLHKKIMWARARKPSWHGTADQRNPFVVMERRLQKEYDEIQNTVAKPNFWIDRESAKTLKPSAGDSYQKYKAKNITIRQLSADKHASSLLEVNELSLGYNGRPLFTGLTFGLQHGQRLRVIGRNGAGKTTLVKAIAAASRDLPIETRLHGRIRCGSKLRLSMYEQELDPSLMELTLSAAIERIYKNLQLAVNQEVVWRAMGDFLFDPRQDGTLEVGQLSGGQKARLQIIKLLASNPNLLILDEPTNHLDLPSIEELEGALLNYQGAILYITHDSYFADIIGGEQLALAA